MKRTSKKIFGKNRGKRKKDKLCGLSEHLKKKKHQLDWSLIKILAKENNYWKRRSKEACTTKLHRYYRVTLHFLDFHKKHFPKLTFPLLITPPLSLPLRE